MKILRERNGLVYHARCSTLNFEHTGEFVFFTETKPDNFFSNGRKIGVLQLLIKIINDMKQNGVTEHEIKNSKGNIKGSSLLSLEDITNQTRYNGEELLMNKTINNITQYSKVYSTHIHGITKQDILNLTCPSNKIASINFLKLSLFIAFSLS